MDFKKKVLVVEDESSLSRALVAKLTSEGFEATAALDGQQALDLLSRESFDLILLDLLLPKVDGFELLQQMNSKNLATPVIVMTNLGQDENKKRAYSLGAKEYFVKSDISIDEIMERCKNFFQK